ERRNERQELAPYRTELFARRMVTSFRAADEEVPILGLGPSPYPATVRHDPVSGKISGYLIEGPRPVRLSHGGKSVYVIGFSSGDFPTERYGINFAWSDRLTGPYRPSL